MSWRRWPPDMFRKYYEAMQTAMIYGSSPGFGEMLDELKLLNGKFRLTDKGKHLEEIIAVGLQNAKRIAAASIEGSIIDIPVHYISDLYLPAGPYNETVTYMLQFIRQKGVLVFQNISVRE